MALTTERLKKMHHTVRTVLFTSTLIFSFALAAAEPTSLTLQTPSSSPFRTTLRGSHCGEIVRSHGFDPNDGIAEIERLEEINRGLERLLRRGQLTLSYWQEQGLVTESDGVRLLEDLLAGEYKGYFDEDTVARLRREAGPDTVPMPNRNRHGDSDSFSDNIQIQPFRQVLFPAARTGIYLTKRALNDFAHQGFDATMLALPGIGFFNSSAKSMAIPTNTFAKGTEKVLPIMNDKTGKRLRILMIPIDTSLNGMQLGAPIAFASPRGVLAVQRHADLYIRTRFPNLPRFALGRSQGGLNVSELSLHYPDIATISLNPSFPSDDVILYSIDKYEHEGPRTGLSSMKDVVLPAWEAHHMFSSRFQAYTHAQRSLAPALTILGEGDPSYPANYPHMIRDWASLQPDSRTVVTIQVPEDELAKHRIVVHTLLRHDCPKTYTKTVGTIASFVQQNLDRMAERQREWFQRPLE